MDYPLVFVFGLVGSIHCVQMCGPIVLAYSLPLPGTTARKSLLAAHLSYNAGRIATYAALGAVAGMAGRALGLLGRLAGLANAAAVVAGILLIITGLSFSGLLPVGTLLRLDPTRILARVHQTVAGLLVAPTNRSKLLLGLALGFLPCGFLYAALLKAMATGNAAAGALTMVCFGLGTAGALILTGLASSALTVPLRRWGNAVAAAGMVLLGALLLYRGIVARGILLPSNSGGPHTGHGHH
jgi:sulfite exporter TauE/SafE